VGVSRGNALIVYYAPYLRRGHKRDIKGTSLGTRKGHERDIAELHSSRWLCKFVVWIKLESKMESVHKIIKRKQKNGLFVKKIIYVDYSSKLKRNVFKTKYFVELDGIGSKGHFTKADAVAEVMKIKKRMKK